METIKLQDLTELKGKESLPEMPELIQRYLDIERYAPEGKFFRIAIDKKSDPKSGAGIAYSNALHIEKKNGDSWSQVYTTGMMQYRGAYAHEIDDWDISLNDPAIFEESESEVVYALRTGVGNIKVYRFREEEGPTRLIVFNADDYKKTQERIGLLQQVIDDAEAFHSYVSKGLGEHWYVDHLSTWEKNCHIFDGAGQKIKNSDQIKKEGAIIVLLARRYDRDYDPLVEGYCFYVWLKGKGIRTSKVYRTGFHHPNTRFYSIEVRSETNIINQSQNSLTLNIEVSNYASYNEPRSYPVPRVDPWKKNHNFRAEWGPGPTDFERDVNEAMERVVQQRQHNHPLYKPTRITESVNDAERLIAAWILFEQIDTDRLSSDGEGWLGDQFRYSLWVMKDGQEPKQLYEDHAYIRPRSKSELTGTRGRDCSLKDLRIEVGSIKVIHPKGERVEQQEPEELAFNL